MLRRLELTVRRRLDGLLHGSYQGLIPGQGTEAGESREYAPGDDVRRMDWPVTARTTVPHVRQTVADRELETWVVFDASASLDFGTARAEKRDVALAGVAALVILAVGGGNRIGALVAGAPTLLRLPARSGMPAARSLLRRVADLQPAAAGREKTELGDALETLRRLPRRRGLVVVVSDFLGDPTWPDPLRSLGALEEVLCLEIVDPRDLDLPDVGLLELVDPESGERLEVQSGQRHVREAYATAAREQRAEIARCIRRAQAGHIQLRTDRDWVLEIVRYVAEQRRRRLR
jgi:uncharacterized protein (DUF58 family)